MAAVAAVAVTELSGCATAGQPSGKDKESAEIHYNLAIESMRNGRMQEALKEFDQSLSQNETFPDAHLGKGLVLEFGFDQLALAEREYRRAIELRANYSEAHNNLGQLLAKMGRFDEAVKSFTTALDNMLYREPFIARCNRGDALHRMGRRDEGIADLRGCLSNNPKYCHGQRVLGRIYMSEGKTKEALEHLGLYARHCDTIADAHYQLGLGYVKSGDAVRARASFEKCEMVGKESPLVGECRKSREMLQ